MDDLPLKMKLNMQRNNSCDYGSNTMSTLAICDKNAKKEEEERDDCRKEMNYREWKELFVYST
jgi:hypothetical protein